MAKIIEGGDDDGTVEQSDVLKLLRRGLVLKPGQSISSVLAGLPADFKGKIVAGILGGQFLMQKEQVPEEPVVNDIVIVVDKGRSEVYVGWENMGETKWIPLNFSRWPLPSHLSPQEGMDCLSWTIFASIDNHILTYDPRLIEEKNRATVLKGGKLRAIAGMQEELVSNWFGFYGALQHFSKSGHGDRFLELLKMELSRRGEFTDRGLGVERLASELVSLGIPNFLIRLGSDGRVVAKADNEADSPSGKFHFKLRQVAPRIFDISIFHNGKWHPLTAKFEGLLDSYTSTQTEVEVPSLEKSADNYKLGLVVKFYERCDYGEWQELLSRLGAQGGEARLTQVLHFFSKHPVFAQYVSSVPTKDAPTEIRSMAAVREVFHVLFDSALWEMERQKAYPKNDGLSSLILNYAMRLYTTEYVGRELAKGEKIDATLPIVPWWGAVEKAVNEIAKKVQPVPLKALLETHRYIASLVAQGLSESELLQKIEQNKEELFVQAPVRWTWNTGEA